MRLTTPRPPLACRPDPQDCKLSRLVGVDADANLDLRCASICRGRGHDAQFVAVKQKMSLLWQVGSVWDAKGDDAKVTNVVEEPKSKRKAWE